MTERRYEYVVEPLSFSPDELRNDRYKFDETLETYASDGWVLDETLRVDSSSFFLVFRRPLDS